ncbi:rifamycin-inactivating phosphotransferase [Micromonospora sp. WMMC273]|uniref:rifamycin-inactivating phosphotransferase n=1 Tax=Micromonospora sp. WMMC273 TaxID=3015157 RepID=UPI0022B67CDF|nr:rifamycin-inactivating phosphotransferase [Micromonospora sp. WMMC273]MCZ7475999.1 phosphoenolpyruvate synthase [Micromonospora sp. WMMC273]
MTGRYVWQLHEVDETRIAAVGGKGAHLGALTRLGGVRVPPGFCVTTDAFRLAVARTPALAGPLERLARADADDPAAIRAAAAEVRRAVERAPLPGEVAAAVTAALAGLGTEAAYAVRSSATAEDLPDASFAGQQDTYLNVVGTAEVLRHVSRCWASLFTDRAVTYRRRHGIDDRAVEMAVVVQRMVVPDAAGVMFTADPVTGDRTVVSIEAGFGLGEALVSGLVNPDVFTVRDGVVAGRTIGAKARAVHAAPGGGTRDTPVDPARQAQPALTGAQAVRLAGLGRRIEAHFGCPQDVEWAVTGDDVHILQSRPITTLFPVPAAAADGRFHVYLSVGHQQMMTDAMRPLGLSMWRLTAMAPMHEAGGRLFVDATPHLSTAAGRAAFLGMIGRADPLTRDALETVLARDVVPVAPDPAPAAPDPAPAGPPASGPPPSIDTDPAIVTALIERSRESVAALRRDIRGRSGSGLFDFLDEAFAEHKRVLTDPVSAQVIMAGMQATWWLNDKLGEWLGERDAADTLTLSAPGNVTAEMGLALLDVADVVRAYPEVVAFLRDGADDGFLDELPKLPGGVEARAAVEGYLDRYGMRCVGEIDITRPRWSECPATLVPLILDHVRTFAPGAAARRFADGRERAWAKAREVLDRLRALPDGERKAAETQAMIDRVRTFAGYREYPKYDIVSRYAVYKQALMAEADRLARAGVLADPEDVFYLTFDEFREVAATGRVDAGLIRRRREEFRSHQALTPPRVLTSDGEALNGSYRRADVPPGALAGLAVSAGVVEGRARVVTDLAGADLEPGDILVTAHTDPSWTPLFVAVAGLVTEVGGLMTHGAVIAREYGLPAVVAVPDATRLIPDGGRIRVHGTDGYVELLS